MEMAFSFQSIVVDMVLDLGGHHLEWYVPNSKNSEIGEVEIRLLLLFSFFFW